MSLWYTIYVAKNYLSLVSHPAVNVQYMYPQIVAADTNGFSDLLYLGGSSIVALWIPGSASVLPGGATQGAWVTANLVVYAAPTDGTQIHASQYGPLYKSNGSLYVIDVPSSVPSTGLMIQVDPYDFIGVDAIQLQSVNTSNSATPVVQTNSPVISVVTIGNGTF